MLCLLPAWRYWLIALAVKNNKMVCFNWNWHFSCHWHQPYLGFVVILYYVKCTQIQNLTFANKRYFHPSIWWRPWVHITSFSLAFLFRIWISILVMVSNQSCPSIGWMFTTGHLEAKILVHLNRRYFSPFVSWFQIKMINYIMSFMHLQP